MSHEIYEPPGSGGTSASLGSLKVHGAGPIEAFVIIEPELRQLFIEADPARDAGAWFFCCTGMLGGAICTLITFAPTEQDFNSRYAVLAALVLASAILALKMYGAWRKHSISYATLLRTLRLRKTR